MPSITACVLTVAVVNVAAAGVVAPITVLSIAPPLISAFAISILPVPEADNFKFELEFVVEIILSVSCMFPSTNNLSIATVPVPEGLITRSSFERVVVMLLPTKDIESLKREDAYTSVNIVFTFCIAALNVSPVPSFAFDPTFNVCCAITKP